MWHLTLDMWHLTHDTWHLTLDTWHVTCDTWHVTHDTWHVTRDTWHVTCHMFGGVNILSKFQLPSSYRLWFMISWKIGRKRVTEWLTEWQRWFLNSPGYTGSVKYYSATVQCKQLQGVFFYWSPQNFLSTKSLYNRQHIEKFWANLHGILNIAKFRGDQ